MSHIFLSGDKMNDKVEPQPDLHNPAPTPEEEARAQRKKAAQELFSCRLREASLTGAAIVEIPPELYEDIDEDEYEEDEDGGG